MRIHSSSLLAVLFLTSSVAAEPGKLSATPTLQTDRAELTELSATRISRLSSLPACFEVEYPNDYVPVYDGSAASGFQPTALDPQGVLLGKAGALVPLGSGEEFVIPVAATLKDKLVSHIALGSDVSAVSLSQITARGRSGDLVGSNYFSAVAVSPSGERKIIQSSSTNAVPGQYDAIGDDGYAYGRREIGIRGTPELLVRARITDAVPVEEILYRPDPQTWVLWNRSNRAGQRTGNYAPWSNRGFISVIADRNGNFRELPPSIELAHQVSEKGEFLTQEVDERGFPIQAIRRWDGSAILKFRAAESQAIMTSINSYRILVGKKQYTEPVVMSAHEPVRTLESMLCSPLRNGQTLHSYADISINDQNEILTEVVGGEHIVAQPVILHPRYTSIQSGGAIKPSSLD